MNYGNYEELKKRGAMSLDSVCVNDNNIVLICEYFLRNPTKTDKLLAWCSLAIPSAILARAVRKITGRKGTLLEKHLMGYYYDMSVKLLSRR